MKIEQFHISYRFLIEVEAGAAFSNREVKWKTVSNICSGFIPSFISKRAMKPDLQEITQHNNSPPAS